MRDKTQEMTRLCEAFLTLKTPGECEALLEDLCTIQELEEMAHRLQTAQLLRRGVNYQEIGRRTAMSTATISRVNRALRYGAGGYEAVLARLEESEAKDAR